MNILHITDLHFSSQSSMKFTQNEMINKLVDYLQSLNENIDLIIFSGDLVFKGDDTTEFYKAKSLFLDKISSALNISSDQIILSAGNHDMNRDFKSNAIETLYKKEITSSDKLYKFFQKGDLDFKNSIKTTENFNEFIRDYYKDSSNVKVQELYTTFSKDINGEKIGIVSINSSWRSVDNKSNGKLLFPSYLLEEALEDIKNCQCKFIVLHHPIHWFREFNQKKLQELIYKNFSIMFSGHIHESEITTHYKQNNGIFACVSPASLTYEKSFIGFSVIQYDLKEVDKALATKYHFNKEKNNFELIDKVEINIPVGKAKAEQNRLREKINSKITSELLNAKGLLLSTEISDDNDNAFIELFNEPKIKLNPKEEVNSSINDKSKNFEFKDLLINNKNYLIYGYDKSGKTSLLKYIQIYHLKNYSKNGNIPFYIDFKEVNLDNIIDEIRKYYELSREKTKEIIKTNNVRLLIDNFEINSPYNKVLSDFLEEFPNVNFILTSDYLTSRVYEEYKIDGRSYEKIYLHDISRNDARTYIGKSTNISNESKDRLLEKVILFCKQLQLPISYWTVSLIMIIHKKSKFDISKNIYNLLDLCVDEILEKKYRVLRKSKLSFLQMKSICGEIAKFLFYKNEVNNYSKKYTELLVMLEKLIASNSRISADARELLEYLIQSGVLKNREDQRISFRLNGIFEFFIAYRMSEDEDLLKEVLDDKVYLSFKNEFEIYSGIKNDDISFLDLIFKKTQNYFEPINKGYQELGTSDLILISKVTSKNDVNLKTIIDSLNPTEPISDEEKDYLRDNFEQVSINSEITLKKHYDVNHLNSEIYERYIAILTRVFKTMDGVNEPELLSKILDFVLETYINFGFYIFEEFEDEYFNLEEKDKENILNTISKILPFVSQLNMTDNIAQHNIEKIILAKIEELKKDSKNNQYKLFILYFILMDIDEENIFNFSDELLSFMDIGILKSSTLIKFNYYFSFLGSNNKRLSDFMKKKIKETQLKIDNKTDKDELQKGLEKKSQSLNFRKR
jgi:hypothetical protein